MVSARPAPIQPSPTRIAPIPSMNRGPIRSTRYPSKGTNQGDVQVGLDGLGEKCPGILQVRDRHHGDNPGDQLGPAVDNARGVYQRGGRSGHRVSSVTTGYTVAILVR